MSYILGTGYYDDGISGLNWFSQLWLENTFLFADPLPERIVVISVGNSHPPYPPVGPDGITRIDTLDLTGNLGHIHQLLGRGGVPKPYDYCGATAAFLALGAIAYANECDLIYKEQDCLAFGLWVYQLLWELNQMPAEMLFGRCRILKSAQSIFVIRHRFIPVFMQYIIQAGSERDEFNMSEQKFTKFMESRPADVRYFSFGYDRDRPFNLKDRVWYAQKFTPQELRDLAAARLISLENMPENVSVFTNKI